MSKKDQLEELLTPRNWEEVQAYVTAAAHNEDGPDHEITDQFYEEAINEIVRENSVAIKIMREDHRKFVELQGFYNELLLAVGNKHNNETRHQTALRYIRQSENQIDGPVQEK